MKSAKKILALILAGVMALAMLTGCGKATSLNRTMAEGLAEYFKSEFAEEGLSNNISEQGTYYLLHIIYIVIIFTFFCYFSFAFFMRITVKE